MNQPGFTVYANSGFQIHFENGWTISVQFGRTHYCSNREMPSDPSELMPVPTRWSEEWSCPNAEIAVFHIESSTWKQFKDETDVVMGWKSPADFAKLVAEVSAWK